MKNDTKAVEVYNVRIWPYALTPEEVRAEYQKALRNVPRLPVKQKP